jgi:hypothetical protein
VLVSSHVAADARSPPTSMRSLSCLGAPCKLCTITFNSHPKTVVAVIGDCVSFPLLWQTTWDKQLQRERIYFGSWLQSMVGWHCF